MASFARLAHCSRAAVTKARDAARVHVDKSGHVDPSHALNREFLAAARARQRKRGAPQKGSRVSNPRGRRSAVPPRRAARGEALPLTIQKLEQEIRFKKRRADLSELDLAERRKQLLPRELVRKWFAIMSADMRAHLLTVPRRAVPHLVGLLESGKEEEALGYLEREISDAIMRVLKGVDDGARKHFASITSGK